MFGRMLTIVFILGAFLGLFFWLTDKKKDDIKAKYSGWRAGIRLAWMYGLHFALVVGIPLGTFAFILWESK